MRVRTKDPFSFEKSPASNKNHNSHQVQVFIYNSQSENDRLPPTKKCSAAQTTEDKSKKGELRWIKLELFTILPASHVYTADIIYICFQLITNLSRPRRSRLSKAVDLTLLFAINFLFSIMKFNHQTAFKKTTQKSRARQASHSSYRDAGVILQTTNCRSTELKI